MSLSTVVLFFKIVLAIWSLEIPYKFKDKFLCLYKNIVEILIEIILNLQINLPSNDISTILFSNPKLWMSFHFYMSSLLYSGICMLVIFCLLILYLTTFLNFFNISNFFGLFCISTYKIMLHGNRNHFIAFFQIWMSFILLPNQTFQ